MANYQYEKGYELGYDEGYTEIKSPQLKQEMLRLKEFFRNFPHKDVYTYTHEEILSILIDGFGVKRKIDTLRGYIDLNELDTARLRSMVIAEINSMTDDERLELCEDLEDPLFRLSLKGETPEAKLARPHRDFHDILNALNFVYEPNRLRSPWATLEERISDAEGCLYRAIYRIAAINRRKS